MYGFSEKLGSSEMILGASGSPEDRSADNRMACKTYLSDSEDQRLPSEHGLGLVSMITHSGSVIIAMFTSPERLSGSQQELPLRYSELHTVVHASLLRSNESFYAICQTPPRRLAC